MKVPSRSRSRSGLAWASCSSSIRAGSILGLTVIVVSFFELVLRDHSKDHAVAVVYLNDTLTAEPYTTLLDSTVRAPSSQRHPPVVEEGRSPVPKPGDAEGDINSHRVSRQAPERLPQPTG